MLGTWCKTCDTGFVPVGQPNRVKALLSEWPTNFPCVVSGCSGRADRVVDMAARVAPKESFEIPIEVYYRALKGMGWRGGRAPAGEAEVRELLLSQRIVDLETMPVGDPERTVVRSLTLESGTRLHFAPSARGGCVYYVEEVGNVGLDSQSDSEESSSDRVETGRDPDEHEEEGPPTDLSANELEGANRPSLSTEGGVRLGDTGSKVSTGDHSEMRVGTGGDSRPDRNR